MSERLKLLLWLHLRTLTRGRSRAAWIGILLLFFLVLVPLSLGAAVLVWHVTRWAGRQPDPRFLGEWVRLALTLVWLLFLLRPVLAFGSNEFFDITKLFHFPVSHRTVFVAQIVGLLFSGTALFFVPALIGLVVALPGGIAIFLVRLAVVLLFLFHGIALGQLIQLGLLNVLRSRKFRDLVPIFGALLSGALYLSFRLLEIVGDPAELISRLLQRQISDWLVAVPSYWAASTLVPGAGIAAWLLLFLGFLPLTGLAVHLASVLQERAFTGELAAARVGRGSRRRRSDRPARFPLTLVPDEVRAVAGKELRILRREPVVKTMLIQQFVFFLVPVAFALWSGVGGRMAGVPLGWAVYPLLFVESMLVLNLYGLEANGFAHLSATPVPRERILLGKLLANLALWETLNLVVLGAIAVFAAALGDPPTPARFALVSIEATAALLVLAGIGAVFSARAPSRLGGRGRGALAQGNAGREGCGTAIIRMAVLALSTLLVLPVALLSRATGSVVLTSFGLVYGFAVFMAGYRFGTRSIEDRELSLVEALTRNP